MSGIPNFVLNALQHPAYDYPSSSFTDTKSKQPNFFKKVCYAIPIDYNKLLTPSEYVDKFNIIKDMEELSENFLISETNSEESFFKYTTLEQLSILKMLLKTLNEKKEIVTEYSDFNDHRLSLKRKTIFLKQIHAIGMAGNYGKSLSNGTFLNQIVIELLSGELMGLIGVDSDIFKVCFMPYLNLDFRICFSIAPKPIETKEETQKLLSLKYNFIDMYLHVLKEVGITTFTVTKEKLIFVSPMTILFFMEVFKCLKKNTLENNNLKTLYLFKYRDEYHISIAFKDNTVKNVSSVYKDELRFDCHCPFIPTNNQLIIKVDF